jgi:hypothetical protein
MLDTTKLKQYASFLGDIEKHTDKYFIENLITEIEKRPKICRNAVEQWLKGAFQDENPDTCIGSYNLMFYRTILEKI